jgi:hypothetical protein
MRYLTIPYVPTSIQFLHFFSFNLPDTLYVFAESTCDDSAIIGNIYICDDQLNLLGLVIGMQATALPKPSSQPPISTALWQSWAATPSFTPVYSESWTNIPSSFQEAEQLLDTLCSIYIDQFFTANSNSSSPLSPSSFPLHRQRYWNYLSSINEQFRTKYSTLPSLDSVLNQVQQLKGFDIEINAIKRVGENLSALLSDPFNVQRILFSDSLMTEVYSESLTFQPYVAILAEIVVDYICQNAERVIHLMELGAGTGSYHKLLLYFTYPYSQITFSFYISILRLL